ncbi:glycoside hydrolase domain-containing protein [Bacillus kwashiorkori]|uniref:glycoside hydrolase domain-containing protein n=1 Tax=Bacillus kwashiorkori TaxID=1522318 RepID=UPI000780CFFB|nr:glycoside hydrolase domain-containing protein [Bacillus kwashiorkori]
MANGEQKQFFEGLLIFLLLFIPLSVLLIFQNNTPPQNNGDGNGSEDKDTSAHHWGVDSASYTTEEFFACVKDNYGSPEVWGRYLGEKEGVSSGITKEEIKLFHDNDIKILLIYNHFTDATGKENGIDRAKHAIKLAEELNVPEGVAIFADIEPDYPVDKDFMLGWMEEMEKSKYVPGIYGVFSDEQAIYAAFNEAAEEDEKIKEKVLLWTAFPQEGVSKKENAPNYQAFGPKDAKILGWQYGLDGETCNIDTNLFKKEILEYLW